MRVLLLILVAGPLAGVSSAESPLLGKGDRIALLGGTFVERMQSTISECRRIVQRVGQREQVPVISIDWQPTGAELTEDQLLPNQAGYGRLASQIADRLVGGPACRNPSAKMRERIAEKNQLFFHHYRPQNETYLLLFRKHEQGNNAVEIEQFRPLIEQADREIWELATR